MTEIVLAGCEPLTLFSHMALYGLGAILESEGVRGVRLGWTGLANRRPYLSADDMDGVALATLIGDHASAHTVDSSWVRRDVTIMVTSQEGPKTATTALMSPRLSPFADTGTWELVQQSRQVELNALTTAQDWLALRYLAALGEPCYWRFRDKGDSLQDEGASRFELQPRNAGSEFVGMRLRKLAGTVALRSPGKILAGLCGESVDDELRKNAVDSRTATGLARPGPTDNALAWCALWGISQFPIAMRINDTADTSGHISGHISHRRKEWFYVPMWKGPWRPARLRSILASQALRTFAASGLGLSGYTDAQVSSARAWLAARNVEGTVRYEIHEIGSGKARERRAVSGEVISVRGVA